MDYLLGASLGGMCAFFYSLPAIYLEWRGQKHASATPFVMHVKTIFGYALKHREAFLVGLFLHVVVGMLFGSLYVLFVDQQWSRFAGRPYQFYSFVFFALASWLFVNVVVYPLLRMGFFGSREGNGIWLETLAAHMLLGATMAGLIYWFQPVYFSLT